MQSASVNNQLETEQVSEKVAPPAYAAQSQSAKSFPESSEEKYCSEPCRGRRHNSSKNGKGCYIAVIVVLVLIILGMVGSIVGLTCFAVICGSESTPEDKSDAANYQLYVIDEVSANGKTASKSDKLTKTALSDSTQKSGSIFVLPIYGTIVSGDWTGSSQSGYVTSEDVTYALKYIAGQENVKALILDINSPGGSVTASDNIYHEIMQFKKENNIPVIAMFEGTACSGGYYSAMAADYIMALPTTWTGSIGVIMEVPEISKLMGKVGVNVNTITSLNANGGASFKDIGSTYRQMRPEERQLLQTLVTQSWNRFTDIVAQGRKGKLTKESLKKIVNDSVSDTITRSLYTTITTLIPVVCLIILGSKGILPFNIAIIIGLVAGFYSSSFLAPQLWCKIESKNLPIDERVSAKKKTEENQDVIVQENNKKTTKKKAKKKKNKK